MTMTSATYVAVFFGPRIELSTIMLGKLSAGPASSTPATARHPCTADQPCTMGTSSALAKYMNAPDTAANRFAKRNCRRRAR